MQWLSRKLFGVVSHYNDINRYLSLRKKLSHVSGYTINQVIDFFDGRKIMPIIAIDDWPLWVNELYGQSVVVIGGYKGVASQRILERVTKIDELHTYEPIPDFADNFVTKDPRSKLFKEAIWTTRGKLAIEIDQDFTYTAESGRVVTEPNRNFKTYIADSITTLDMLERVTNKDDYSIFMNCEGAEYRIVEDFLKLEKVPKTIMFQSHHIGLTTIPSLYKTRFDLANHGYVPVLNLNFAWDIWTLASRKS